MHHLILRNESLITLYHKQYGELNSSSLSLQYIINSPNENV